MIVLYDAGSTLSTALSAARALIGTMVRAVTHTWPKHNALKLSQARERNKELKADRLALQRLLQTDDALLKDMGIERRDLEAVKNGALTLDAMNKHDIVAARDISSNTNSIWKKP